MSAITTHVLDVVLGKPGVGIHVTLEVFQNGIWARVADGLTDVDGRCRDLAPDARSGAYRLTFRTGEYFAGERRSTLYPEVSITFELGSDPNYHLPLLLSNNSYTTYRGS